MSRIGKLPIPVPSGVEITSAADGEVTVKGPRGSLTRKFSPDMTIAREDGVILVKRPTDEDRHRALHGLTRTLVSNMVTGVSTGFRLILEIEGVGYRASVAGENLNLALGFSHPVVMVPLPGIKFEAGADPATRRQFIAIIGSDKEIVGQQAAVIRKLRPPEPYKGKGIRYQGEIIRRKAGKAGKAGGKGAKKK